MKHSRNETAPVDLMKDKLARLIALNFTKGEIEKLKAVMDSSDIHDVNKRALAYKIDAVRCPDCEEYFLPEELTTHNCED